MNKQELITAISEQAGLSKTDAGKALEALTGTIADAMKQGAACRLRYIRNRKKGSERGQESRNRSKN